MAVPPGISTWVSRVFISLSAISPSPIWRRQRFTLASRPPPVPPSMLMPSSALASPGPAIINFDTCIWPAGTSRQPAGTAQAGLPELARAGVCLALVLRALGGLESCADSEEVNDTDLRN